MGGKCWEQCRTQYCATEGWPDGVVNVRMANNLPTYQNCVGDLKLLKILSFPDCSSFVRLKAWPDLTADPPYPLPAISRLATSPGFGKWD